MRRREDKITRRGGDYERRRGNGRIGQEEDRRTLVDKRRTGGHL